MLPRYVLPSLSKSTALCHMFLASHGVCGGGPQIKQPTSASPTLSTPSQDPIHLPTTRSARILLVSRMLCYLLNST